MEVGSIPGCVVLKSFAVTVNLLQDRFRCVFTNFPFFLWMKRNLRNSKRNNSGNSNKRNNDSIGETKAGKTTIRKSDRNVKQGKEQKLAVITVNSKDDKSDHSDGDETDDSQSFDEGENVAIVRPSKPPKKRTRRRPPEKYAEYAAYRGHKTSWAVLSKTEKHQLAVRAFAESADGTVKCLNEKCTKTLKSMEDIVSHVDKCLKLPEYFKYMGKADVFRALDKVTKAKILRVSMNALEVLPCLNVETLNCTQKYGHLYALSYHLERCGQERDQLPWKCWKCGYATIVANGREHLAKCTNPKIGGRGQRSDDESYSENSESDELDVDISKKFKKNRKSDKQKMASIVQEYLPEKSSRMRMTDGVKRFKFKSANLEANAPTPSDLMQYQETIDRANELLRAQREKESLCDLLVKFEHHPNNFKRIAPHDFSEDLNIMLNKYSIPVMLPSGDSDEWQSTSSNERRTSGVKNVRKHRIAEEKQRLPVFVPKPLHYKTKKAHFMLTENNIHEIGSIAYCGGPISTIKSCPRKLEDGRECVAVTVFTDEEYLISKDRKNNTDYVQFWLYDNKSERISASFWFLLEVNHSTILCTAWCPSLRNSVKHDNKLSNFVGILAVGGMNGPISLYGIRSDIPVPSINNNNPLVYRCSKPDLILCCPDCCKNIPIISIAWSEKGGSNKLASVSASGHVLIWDLNESTTSAKIIYDTEWLSPPLSVVFCGMGQLAVSFREKLIRIYDLTTLTFVIEEGAQRTAGMQVYSREGLFNGIFSYQQDFTLSGMHLTCGTCYIVLGSSKENFFVVPLANKHEVQLWDMCICPKTGAIISAGADGRLQVSLNGRLAAIRSEKDFVFNACRVVLTLVRKSEEVPLAKAVVPPLNDDVNADDSAECENEARFPPPQTNLQLCAEKSHLEFCFEDIKIGKTAISQFSLDLRTESLNRLAVSEPSGKLAICGGEAGLLIFIPCFLR
uniref:Bm7241 n=1 Tax=Brugia malayi TaxID=6279 RepID=A0A0H5S176_BRUMA|nr:Bm7241 [Brugia malayi]